MTSVQLDNCTRKLPKTRTVSYRGYLFQDHLYSQRLPNNFLTCLSLGMTYYGDVGLWP